MATGDGCHGGTRDTPQVDTAVLVEALVLDVDGALQHVRRDLVLGDGLAVLRVEARDLVAVAIDDLGGFTHQIGVGVGIVGQIGQPTVDVADHADAKRYARDEQKAQEREQESWAGHASWNDCVPVVGEDPYIDLQVCRAGRRVRRWGRMDISYYTINKRGARGLVYAG